MSALVILNISVMGSNFRALWVLILEHHFKQSIKKLGQILLDIAWTLVILNVCIRKDLLDIAWTA